MMGLLVSSEAIPYGAAIATFVLVVGTPLLWRALRGTAPAIRAFVGALGCIGLSGLIGLPFSLSGDRYLDNVTVGAVLISAILQVVAAIILFLLPRRA